MFLLFIFSSLNFLLQSSHLIFLRFNQLRLKSHFLFVSLFFKFSELFSFHLVCSNLNLMSFSIIFLLGQRQLDFLQIQKFCGRLENVRQFFLQLL